MISLKKMCSLILEQEGGDANLLEFPNGNLNVTVDRPKKRLIFSPRDGMKYSGNLRTLIVMLKQRFKISKINSLEDEDDAGEGDVDDPKLRGVFEVVLDPRENLDNVLSFVKSNAIVSFIFILPC